MGVDYPWEEGKIFHNRGYGVTSVGGEENTYFAQNLCRFCLSKPTQRNRTYTVEDLLFHKGELIAIRTVTMIHQ